MAYSDVVVDWIGLPALSLCLHVCTVLWGNNINIVEINEHKNTNMFMSIIIYFIR